MKYTWMVMAPESIDSTMVAIKELLADHNGPTLELEPGALPPGHKFVFSVRVTSFWGLRDTAALTVATEATPESPVVTVHGPKVDYIDSSEPYYLEGDASTPSLSCIEGAGLEGQTGDLRFRWTVTPEIFFHPTMLKVMPLFSFPPLHLPVPQASWVANSMIAIELTSGCCMWLSRSIWSELSPSVHLCRRSRTPGSRSRRVCCFRGGATRGR